MNCMWPIAPAQEPFMSTALTWPASMMRSASSSWLRKNPLRRPSQASVARLAGTLRLPCTSP